MLIPYATNQNAFVVLESFYQQCFEVSVNISMLHPSELTSEMNQIHSIKIHFTKKMIPL